MYHEEQEQRGRPANRTGNSVQRCVRGAQRSRAPRSASRGTSPCCARTAASPSPALEGDKAHDQIVARAAASSCHAEGIIPKTLAHHLMGASTHEQNFSSENMMHY
eukprot:6208039-Pleurochrysis_carterae.AAC.3